ncbi:uncharacterized protein LOC131661542 [Vicia villosa]|uniref:uncharacterized protein LOC131661542 n=1 Tax=Vicia villosa TaxID=3911 RepID=UPI00273C69C5|nr:uncharacterized protein LOC131661542 [Vicia villosa]
MLSKKAVDWWVATRAELDADGVAITWAVFRREFLRRCFPEHVRGRKEIEFLKLKLGNLTVLEYASKFVELANVENFAMTARQMNEAVKDGAAVFMLFASMDVKGKELSSELPVERDFPEVFPKDVRELPPKREVEFAIDLISKTRHVLMAPYRMSAS